MPGKCKIITWDRNYHVRGIIASPKGILASAEAAPGTPFPSQLREVNNALKKHRTDAIVLGGFLPEYVCFELPSPDVDRKTLKDMLRFELPGRIPVPVEGMNLFFRQIKRENGKKTRIFGVRSRVWRNLTDQLKESGVRFDAFCHPFMAAGLTEEHPGAAFPEIAPGLELAAGEDGLAALRKSDSLSAAKADAMESIAAYVQSGDFARDKPFLSDLPEEFKLHRFKTAKRTALLLSFLVLVLGSLFLYRQWSDRDRQVGHYQRVIRQLDERLLAQNAKIEEERALGLFAGKMLAAVDEEPILPVLSVLSRKLPANAWITSFRGANNRIALTLSVSGDSGALDNALLELDSWELENQRRQDGPDGTGTWYITLKRK